MKFSDKLKKIRRDNNLTQEELAEKIFVTRSAISKWETDNGYPGMDSLKMLSKVFDISIDELISDEDVENSRLLEKKTARKMYFLAAACLIVSAASVIMTHFFNNRLLSILSTAGLIGYVIFGILTKPKYKRLEARRLIVTYLISRVVIMTVVIAVAVKIISDMGL